MWKSPALQGNSVFIPDTAIVVQDQLFQAHRVLLTAHSGYFNTLLNDCEEKPPDTHRVINLSRISAHSFSVLLSFLYDGQLRVTISDINEVLFAAEYLNMPAAVLTCKYFIEQNFPLLAGITSPCRSQFLYPEFFNPAIRNPVSTLPNPYLHGLSTIIPTHLPIRPIPTVPHNSTRTPIETITRESTKNLETKHDNQNSKHESDSNDDDHYVSVDSPTTITNKGHLLFSLRQNLDQSKNNCTSDTTVSNDDNPPRFVIDIAACDGPVRFERVLNKNYKSNANKENCDLKPTNTNNNDDSIDSTSNLSAVINLTEESNSSTKSSGEDASKTEGHKLYHCIFCNHSFKSYYCYEKHKQRHINPKSLDKNQAPRESAVKTNTNQPLELNVAFYPCKMCGGKFPSYYFVHKHKKFCKGKPENGPV